MKHRTSRNRQDHKFQSGQMQRIPVAHWLRHRSLSFAVVLALVVIGLHVLTSGIPAQEESTSPDAQAIAANPDPPGTIDGAKNPELIPDHVAYRMIGLAVAEPADPSDEQKARARAKISAIGFSDEDAAAFLALLAEFRTEDEPFAKQAAELLTRTPFPHPDSIDYEQLVNLGRKRDQLLANTVAAFPARLSQDGLVKLWAYLPEAKKEMKIIPDMPTP